MFTNESWKVIDQRCIDLDNIPLFGRNASKFCYLEVIKSKKTVKQMHFIKKIFPYLINFPSLSKHYNNLNHVFWGRFWKSFDPLCQKHLHGITDSETSIIGYAVVNDECSHWDRFKLLRCASLWAKGVKMLVLIWNENFYEKCF